MAVFAACAMLGRFRAVITVAASIDPRAGCHPIRIIACMVTPNKWTPTVGNLGHPDMLRPRRPPRQAGLFIAIAA